MYNSSELWILLKKKQLSENQVLNWAPCGTISSDYAERVVHFIFLSGGMTANNLVIRRSRYFWATKFSHISRYRLSAASLLRVMESSKKTTTNVAPAVQVCTFILCRWKRLLSAQGGRGRFIKVAAYNVCISEKSASFLGHGKSTGLLIEHNDFLLSSRSQPPRECCFWSPSTKYKTRAFDFAAWQQFSRTFHRNESTISSPAFQSTMTQERTIPGCPWAFADDMRGIIDKKEFRFGTFDR